MNTFLYKVIVASLAMACGTVPATAGEWTAGEHRTVLKNDSMVARFQSGILYALTDRNTGGRLIHVEPRKLPATFPLFEDSGVELNNCIVSHTLTSDSVACKLRGSDGTELALHWTIEPGHGDLILRMSAKSPEPVSTMRYVLSGCDIANYSLITVNAGGGGEVFQAPWTDVFIDDPKTGPSPRLWIHPLVALFRGQESGWFVEGRELRIGPAVMMAKGQGKTADIGFVRDLVEPTRRPEMFEIRFRTYRNHWEDAVDPYVEWMKKGLGFVPLDQADPKWVRNIKSHAYVKVGDFNGLDLLAQKLNPSAVLLGRYYSFRKFPMGVRNSDYSVDETAGRWFKRARELGFHVGAGFNAFAVSADQPELVNQFRRGFEILGADDGGNDYYFSLPRSPTTDRMIYYYCTPAFAPWRKYLIKEVGHSVAAGADMVYYDEAMCPCGRYVVDGATAVEGILSLGKETREAYPHVAVETEQFNPMAARHSAFALSQHHLGHPLGGYIFHHFIRIIPEGIMHQPTDDQDLDGFQSWGFLTPSGNSEASWLQIAQAFHEYDLVPDSRLPHKEFLRFEKGKSGGQVPVTDQEVPPGGIRLFGYHGRDGVTAFYEKQKNKRGLVIYEPDKSPRWIGTRVRGLRTWSGPGVLREIIPGPEVEVDWVVYDGETQLGLDPATTYFVDPQGKFDRTRFHVNRVPENFALHVEQPSYIPSQNAGRGGSYFKIAFTGQGEMGMHVPGDMAVFLDGDKVQVGPAAGGALIRVNAPTKKPGVLLAFPRTDVELAGSIGELPWQRPPLMRPGFVTQSRPVDGSHPARDFSVGVTGVFLLVGEFPAASSIRLQGGYAMQEDSFYEVKGDAVVRVNGQEVMRIDPGTRPYPRHEFDVDISRFAGQHVHIEFVCDGRLTAPAGADWFDPRIVVQMD